jgi:hypothetical protein
MARDNVDRHVVPGAVLPVVTMRPAERQMIADSVGYKR